jgi:hypothetical protein
MSADVTTTPTIAISTANNQTKLSKGMLSRCGRNRGALVTDGTAARRNRPVHPPGYSANGVLVFARD